jgi:hypothetical protein
MRLTSYRSDVEATIMVIKGGRIISLPKMVFNHP